MYVNVTEVVESAVGVTEILVEPDVAQAEPPVTVPIEETVKASLSASVSLLITSTIIELSSLTTSVSSLATGGVLLVETLFTATETVAVALWPLPSLIW